MSLLPVLLLGVLLAGCAGEGRSPGDAALTLDAELARYEPGSRISWDRYRALGDAFAAEWSGHRPSEAAMQQLLDAAEPEALLAMLRLLDDPTANVNYGSYAAIPERIEREFLHDGLVGLRVIRDTEIVVNGRPRLVSGIFTYDPRNFRPRRAPDSIRLRVEIEPFRPRTATAGPRGFLGFSWSTGGADRLEVHVDRYISDEVLRRELASPHPRTHAHSAMRFPGVGACAFANHCNVCHHSTLRSFVTDEHRRTPLLAQEGARQVLEALAPTPSLSWAILANALSQPARTFPVAPLREAFARRWQARRRGR